MAHAGRCTHRPVGLPDAGGSRSSGFPGYPPRYLGWSQYRALGAAALDLCAVAEGVLDAYAAVGGSQLGSWDYLGGMLICTEAGAVVEESAGRELFTLEHADRRTPVAAARPRPFCRRWAGHRDLNAPPTARPPSHPPVGPEEQLQNFALGWGVWRAEVCG